MSRRQKNKKIAEDTTIKSTNNYSTGLDDLLSKQIEEARKKREWRAFIVQIIFVIAAVYLLLTFVIGIAIVHGDSMTPNYHSNDVCLLWRLDSKYEYGDVVFFESEGAGEILVKRVIAGPGDTIEINNDGQVIVNNVILNERLIYAETYAYVGGPEYPLTMGDNEYFCLGDIRTNSMDSRDSRVGVVNRSDIKGKVVFTVRVGSHN